MLVSLIYGRGTRPSGSSLDRSFALVRPCYSAHVPSFHISYYPLIIILVSAHISSFTFAVSMREVYCVVYTPRAWDPRSLQSILNIPLVFYVFATSSKRLKPRIYNNNNNATNMVSKYFLCD